MDKTDRERIAMEAIEGEIDYGRACNYGNAKVSELVLEKMKALGYTRQPEHDDLVEPEDDREVAIARSNAVGLGLMPPEPTPVPELTKVENPYPEWETLACQKHNVRWLLFDAGSCAQLAHDQDTLNKAEQIGGGQVDKPHSKQRR